MNSSSTVENTKGALTGSPDAQSFQPQSPASHPSYHPPQVSQLIGEIERMERELQEKMELLARQKQEQEEQLITQRNTTIDEFKQRLGVTTDEDLILIIRNRGKDVLSKNKRLTQAVLDEMKWALKNGATAPAVAKHFKVSIATVHSRKAAWRLTHRKGVKPTPVLMALKGFPRNASG